MFLSGLQNSFLDEHKARRNLSDRNCVLLKRQLYGIKGAFKRNAVTTVF